MNRLIWGTALVLFASCNAPASSTEKQEEPAIEGTWKLVSGTLITQSDTIVTDYIKGKSFIKIINKSHFAFLGHDLQNGKDTTAFYSSGGGRYELNDSAYTEHLEYCSDRQWEGNDFHFTISFDNDTLIQKGIEKIASAGVDRINIEKYVRWK